MFLCLNETIFYFQITVFQLGDVVGMVSHVIDLPLRVVVGSGVLKEVHRHIKELRLGSKAAIISGPGPTRAYAKNLVELLSDNSIEVSTYITRSTFITELEDLCNSVKEFKPDLVIGVGGGKAIDSAKYIAFKLGIRMVSIPTAPSHDGIASPFTSVKGLARPTSIKTVMPSLVVADIDIISMAPRRYVIAGCGDLLGKITAVLDWKLAHRLRGEYYGEYAASLARLSASHIIRFARLFRAKTISKEAVRTLIEALISSGVAMGIAGSTRPASGSEHLFAHALDIVANYPALHGEEVGVGTIMMLYLHGKNWRRIKRILKLIGAPTTAKELGVSSDKIIKALTIAHTIRPERYTILGERGLTWEAAERLARITGVID